MRNLIKGGLVQLQSLDFRKLSQSEGLLERWESAISGSNESPCVLITRWYQGRV